MVIIVIRSLFTGASHFKFHPILNTDIFFCIFIRLNFPFWQKSNIFIQNIWRHLVINMNIFFLFFIPIIIKFIQGCWPQIPIITEIFFISSLFFFISMFMTFGYCCEVNVQWDRNECYPFFHWDGKWPMSDEWMERTFESSRIQAAIHFFISYFLIIKTKWK